MPSLTGAGTQTPFSAAKGLVFFLLVFAAVVLVFHGAATGNVVFQLQGDAPFFAAELIGPEPGATFFPTDSITFSADITGPNNSPFVMALLIKKDGPSSLEDAIDAKNMRASQPYEYVAVPAPTFSE